MGHVRGESELGVQEHDPHAVGSEVVTRERSPDGGFQEMACPDEFRQGRVRFYQMFGSGLRHLEILCHLLCGVSDTMTSVNGYGGRARPM
jgi:hypothetical protein